MDSSSEELNNFFSPLSSDDDDDLELLCLPKSRNNSFLEHAVSKFDEETFFRHFQVSRDVAAKIAEKYRQSSYFKQDNRGHHGKIPALHQLLIFLWFVGHKTSSFFDISQHFGISLSSLHRIINRLTYFLSNLSPHVLKWPNEEDRKTSEAYFKARGFPNVIGAIDTIHVKIDKPGDDPKSYMNSRGYYSIQMQAVCDHSRRIIDVFIGYPGSVDIGQVFKRSPLSQNLSKKCGSYILLGNSEYPLLKNLMTPFEDRQISKKQMNYNIKHSKNYYVIEHCFGMLKQTFRQLYHIKLRKIPVIVHLIRACCVLHNIVLDGDLICNDENQVSTADVAPASDTDNEAEDETETEALVVRQAIAESLPF